MKRRILGLTCAVAVVVVGTIVIRLNLSTAPEAEVGTQGLAGLQSEVIPNVAGGNPLRTDPLRASESAFISIAKDVYPAVVSITTVHVEKIGGYRYRFHGRGPFGEDFFDDFFREFFGGFPEREYRAVGLGSGVIIDKKGYILTNHHVVEGAEKDQVTVKLPDGREFKGEITGVDSRSDLAIVKIKAKDLPVARLGDSDKLEIGQWAIAIGNPFGFVLGDPNPTMTVGVISALHRTLPQTLETDRYYGDLIQTDAAINRGNSGGPLVSINGEVIGINVAIFSTTGGYQGIGFAIPINTAREVIDDLIKGKRVLYGWLGVKVQDITQSLAEYFDLSEREGVLVAEVLSGGPAFAGGLKDGDIIRTYDGEEVKNTQELIKRVSRTEVGKKVEVGVTREKKALSLLVEIGERPTSLAELRGLPEPTAWRGLEVSEISPELARRFNLTETKGVVVTNVEVGSPADEAGLREGDVINEIDRTAVESLSDYNRCISKAKGRTLIRANRGYFVIKESEG